MIKRPPSNKRPSFEPKFWLAPGHLLQEIRFNTIFFNSYVTLCNLKTQWKCFYAFLCNAADKNSMMFVAYLTFNDCLVSVIMTSCNDKFTWKSTTMHSLKYFQRNLYILNMCFTFLYFPHVVYHRVSETKQKTV